MADGFAVQWGGVGDERRGLMTGGIGQHHGAAEAASEEGGRCASQRILLQGLNGVVKIAAA